MARRTGGMVRDDSINGAPEHSCHSGSMGGVGRIADNGHFNDRLDIQLLCLSTLFLWRPGRYVILLISGAKRRDVDSEQGLYLTHTISII